MKEEILFTILGGLIGYIGAVIQHNLESRRQKASAIRQEKLRIYSNVLSELSGLFIDADTYAEELRKPDYTFKYGIRLGRILGPARLIASAELEGKLRDLFSDEINWHEYMTQHTDEDKEWKGLASKATETRMQVEHEMRKEILNEA